MKPPHAREIAAADLVGRRLRTRRQRVVLAEFAVSVVVGVGVSAFALAHTGVWGLVVGLAALGFAANYGLLLYCAIALLRTREVLERLVSSPEWPSGCAEHRGSSCGCSSRSRSSRHGAAKADCLS